MFDFDPQIFSQADKPCNHLGTKGVVLYMPFEYLKFLGLQFLYNIMIDTLMQSIVMF